MKAMHPMFTAAVSAAALICASIVYPPEAEAQSRRCNDAVQAITSDMQSRIGARVVNVNFRQITEPPYSPYKEKGELRISLDGGRGADVMSSGRLLADYSDQLIKACQKVVRVEYSLNSTDWVRSYSWINNRMTMEDQCIPAGRNRSYSLQWGQQICL